jgi:hypothetical protein
LAILAARARAEAEAPERDGPAFNALFFSESKVFSFLGLGIPLFRQASTAFTNSFVMQL